ncbi:MAG: hypothetical protein ABI294_00465, partial [Casimicrobiaceae bacterium]
DAGSSAGSSTDNNAATPAAPPESTPATEGTAAHKAPAKAVAKPRPQPVPHTAVPEASEKRSVPAPAVRAAPRPDRWSQMASEIDACGRGNFVEKVICEQKVRINYCDGYWGKVPQCPTGPAPTTGG